MNKKQSKIKENFYRKHPYQNALIWVLLWIFFFGIMQYLSISTFYGSNLCLYELNYKDCVFTGGVIYKQDYCIKSRPKTNYEKHPEDYVTEIIYPQQEEIFYDTRELTPLNIPYIIINLTNSFYIYHKNSKYYLFNFQEIINDKPLDRDLLLYKIIVRFKDLRINQTTYSLKNECEKGNPDWVEETKIKSQKMNDSCAREFIQIYPDVDDCIFLITENGIYRCESVRDVCSSKENSIKEFQTICREKTEDEKLMDKDCGELFISYATKKKFMNNVIKD